MGFASLTLFLMGCRSEGVELNMSHIEGTSETVGASLSATSPKGNPIPLSNNNTTIYIETATTGGVYEPASNIQVYFNGTCFVDAVVVADNSGSEADYIEDIRSAVDGFSSVILARQQPDRVGLVRVSTNASVMSELTADSSDIEGPIDEMFVNQGWTALWDGVRMGNDVLQDGAVLHSNNQICVDPAYRSVVVFTDGQENNSADQQQSASDGDGIDTTLDDLLELSIHDQQTAVYTIGVGNDVDEEALMTLAEETGGSYRHINNYGGLVGALRSMANTLTEQVPVCFTRSSCDHDTARIYFDFIYRGQLVQRTFDVSLPTCTP